MNRRSFFGFIAAAPLLPVAAKAEPQNLDWAQGELPSTVNNSARAAMAYYSEYGHLDVINVSIPHASSHR